MVGVHGQDAQRRRRKRKMAPFDDRQADPAGGERRAKLAVRKQRDRPSQRACPHDHAIGAVIDLDRRLAIGTAIPEHIPVRPCPANIPGAKAFVGAVVPLGEVRLDLGRRRQAGQAASVHGPTSRTGEDGDEAHIPEPRRQIASGGLAGRRQRQIRAAGVPARERPVGLAMPDEIEPWRLCGALCHAASIAGP